MPDQPTTVLRLPDGRYVTPEQAQGMTFHDDYKPVEGVWTPQPSPREASSVRKQHDDGARALSPDEINADLAEHMGWMRVPEAWPPPPYPWREGGLDPGYGEYRDPTECLNACAVVARKAGASVLIGYAQDHASARDCRRRSGRAASSGVLGEVNPPLAVATALHRLLFPEKHND